MVKSITIDTKLKAFYVAKYPGDEMGKSISGKPTFKDLHDALKNGRNVYHVFEYADSIIRERLFEQLAIILKTSYNYVYQMWLKHA